MIYNIFMFNTILAIIQVRITNKELIITSKSKVML